MRLGAALDLYMRIHKIEGKQLAETLGVGASTISRMRSGDTAPDAYTFAKIIAWLAEVEP